MDIESTSFDGVSTGGVDGSDGRLGGGTLRDASDDFAWCKDGFCGEGVDREDATGRVSRLGRPLAIERVSVLPSCIELRL